MIDAKVIIVGNSYVGKTSLVHRYVHQEHASNLGQTIGAAFYSVKEKINNNEVRYFIWDTAGEEKFRSIGKMYYRGSKGCLCIFNVTDRKSFDDLEYWINTVKESAPDNIKILLLATKTDLDKKLWTVTIEEIEKLSKKIGLEYYLTSAVTGENVNKCFKILGEHCLKITENNDAYFKLQEISSLKENCYCNII